VIISQAIIAWAKSRKQSLRDDHPQSVAQEFARVVTRQRPAVRRSKSFLSKLFLPVALLVLAGAVVGVAYFFASLESFFHEELGLGRPWTWLIAYLILDGHVFAMWYLFQGGRNTLFGPRPIRERS